MLVLVPMVSDLGSVSKVPVETITKVKKQDANNELTKQTTRNVILS